MFFLTPDIKLCPKCNREIEEGLMGLAKHWNEYHNMKNLQPMNITDKEKRIIELKAEGKTVKQIAREITTSRPYTEQLIHDLYQKTGCRNGGSLVAWGYRNGVLEIKRGNLPNNGEAAA
jgi:DNA-binding CsgD family transcriptional regulator